MYWYIYMVSPNAAPLFISFQQVQLRQGRKTYLLNAEHHEKEVFVYGNSNLTCLLYMKIKDVVATAREHI